MYETNAEDQDNLPSSNGDNGLDEGRDNKGRFAKGNPGGPGNPRARDVSAFRKAVFDAVSLEDLTAIILNTVARAKAGEAWAVHEVLDRCLGKPQVQVELQGFADAQQELSAERRARAIKLAHLIQPTDCDEADERDRLVAEYANLHIQKQPTAQDGVIPKTAEGTSPERPAENGWQDKP